MTASMNGELRSEWFAYGIVIVQEERKNSNVAVGWQGYLFLLTSMFIYVNNVLYMYYVIDLVT